MYGTLQAVDVTVSGAPDENVTIPEISQLLMIPFTTGCEMAKRRFPKGNWYENVPENTLGRSMVPTAFSIPALYAVLPALPVCPHIRSALPPA